MRSVEGEGITIDDAIARALAALGVRRDRAEIDIIENASRGVLGIGRRKARVRATVRAPLETLMGAVAGDPEAAGAAEGRVLPSAPSPAPPASERSAGADGAGILKVILERMQLDVSVVETGGAKDERVLRVEGPDLAAAIGRRGEVLDALEYLVNRIAERTGRVRGRFVVDAAGFRAQRKVGLEERARRLAERARLRGKPIATSPLSPGDRRVVYLALKSETGVAARSVGQGFYRKLVIIPEGGRRGGGKATQ